eukprot:tig00020604_g11862.t1
MLPVVFEVLLGAIRIGPRRAGVTLAHRCRHAGMPLCSQQQAHRVATEERGAAGGARGGTRGGVLHRGSPAGAEPHA